MNGLRRITDQQLEEEIQNANWELELMEEDGSERTSRWYSRRNGWSNMLKRFQEELERRKDQARKLELFGSLNIESEDPNQLTLPL